MSKVAIVGMGSVGSSTAYNLGIKQTVDTILAIDHNQDLAKMQVKDLLESFIIENSKTRIEYNNYENLSDVDILVITAGAPVSVVDDRLELFDSSVTIMKDIVAKSITAGFKGIYLVASNPVDVMTAAVYKYAGVDSNFVMGSGTILDNARLINELSSELNIDPKDINSACIGEHGNSIVPLFSNLKINNQSLDDYILANNITIDFEKLVEKVKAGGPQIFAVKGATEFGIGSSLVKIINGIINDTNEILTVTNLTNVEGVGEVYIPDFVTVNQQGYKALDIELSNDEYNLFIESAKTLSEFSKLIK